jgi:hypothetical protein
VLSIAKIGSSYPSNKNSRTHVDIFKNIKIMNEVIFLAMRLMQNIFLNLFHHYPKNRNNVNYPNL